MENLRYQAKQLEYVIDNLYSYPSCCICNNYVNIVKYQNLIFKTENDPPHSTTIFVLTNLVYEKKLWSNTEVIICIYLVYLINKYKICIYSSTKNDLINLYLEYVKKWKNKPDYELIDLSQECVQGWKSKPNYGLKNKAVIDSNHRYGNGLSSHHVRFILKNILSDIPFVYKTWQIEKIYTEKCPMVESMIRHNGGSQYVVFPLITSSDSDGESHLNAVVYNPTNNIWIRMEPHGIEIDSNWKQGDDCIDYHVFDCHIYKYISNYQSHNTYDFLPGIQGHQSGCGLFACIMIEEYMRQNDIFKAIEKLTFQDYVDEKLKHYISLLDQYESQNEKLIYV